MPSTRSKILWRVSILTSLEAEDAVTELLQNVTGTSTAAYHNLETGISTVSAFRQNSFDRSIRSEIISGLKQIVSCGLNIRPGKIQIARVKREDWSESWKKHFKPLEIGRVLLVKPSWIKRRLRPGQAVVVLDPGLSFGTGQHPTTSFCLQQLARHAQLSTLNLSQ